MSLCSWSEKCRLVPESMIAIFDYGAGNLRSVENTLDSIGALASQEIKDVPSSV